MAISLAQVASQLVAFFLNFWTDFDFEETCPRVHHIPGEKIVLGDDVVCVEYGSTVLHLRLPKLSAKSEEKLNIFFAEKVFPQLSGNRVLVIYREESSLRYRLELVGGELE